MGKKNGKKLADQDWYNGWYSNPLMTAVKIADPTGISSWPDVAAAWGDGEFNYKDIVEPLGALPMVGKAGKIISAGAKIVKPGSRFARLSEEYNAARKIIDAKVVNPNAPKIRGRAIGPNKTMNPNSVKDQISAAKKINEYKSHYKNVDNLILGGRAVMKAPGMIDDATDTIDAYEKTKSMIDAVNKKQAGIMPSFNNGLSAFDYIGNAASLASTGMSLGGPIGGALGAVAGIGMSIYQNQQMEEQKRLLANQTKFANTRSLSNMVKSNYDMNTGTNTGIPGFKDGLSQFMPQMPGIPNAYVSSEEVIKNPMTGELNEVPGKYSQANPDQVMTNLMPGSSVFSSNPKNKLPFGKSTPADIASKMAKVQANADKVLSGNGSSLDKRTAELNKMNIEKQTQNLDKMTYLQQTYSNPMSMLPKFDDGLTPWWIQGKDKWISRNMDSLQGKSNAESDEMYKKFVDDKISGANKIKGAISDMASLSPVASNLFDRPETASPIFAQYMNPMISYNMAPELADMTDQSRISRYNQSKLGGAGMAYGSANYGQTLSNRSKVFSNANRFAAEQKAGYADRFNQAQGVDAAEMRRIQDLNMRNRATTRSTQRAGLTQLGQYAQNKQLMGNQRMNDIMNANIWGAYASDMNPEIKKFIENELAKRLKS